VEDKHTDEHDDGDEDKADEEGEKPGSEERVDEAKAGEKQPVQQRQARDLELAQLRPLEPAAFLTARLWLSHFGRASPRRRAPLWPSTRPLVGSVGRARGGTM